MLGRYAIERRPDYDLPKRVHDMNSDGVPDLIFSSDVQPLCVTVLSGKDLATLGQLENLWPEAGGGVEWAMSVYHDDNGDGIPESLVRRRTPGKTSDSRASWEYAVLDGQTFGVLRTFQSPRPRVGAKTFFATVPDVNGDAVGDFVFSCGAGGGPTGDQSLLRAVSGADGAVMWDVGGHEMGEGVEVWRMDVRSGEKESLGRDVGFGHAVVAGPDLDEDDMGDLAVLAEAVYDARPAVLVVSGKTGELISVLAPDDGQGQLRYSTEMIRLDPRSTPDMLTVAAWARSPEGDATVAILEASAP
jgi:hypothetical protein